MSQAVNPIINWIIVTYQFESQNVGQTFVYFLYTTKEMVHSTPNPCTLNSLFLVGYRTEVVERGMEEPKML